MTKSETMGAFFSTRLAGYDRHTIAEAEGCREAYARMAELLPAGCKELWGLGCGTGSEPNGPSYRQQK